MPFVLQWHVDEGYDADSAARLLSVDSDTWTDGSMVRDDVSQVCAAGFGMLSKHSSYI